VTTPTRHSFVGLLLGTILLVGGLTALAGWALPVVVASVLFMVMVHEFGHYITAKRSGMLVTDFFVGFGPVLWSTQRGETRYGIRALPLGGYVKVPGMTWTDTIDPALEQRTYRSASYPRKVIFASAGSFMHLVMALLLAWSALVFFGTTNTKDVGVAGLEVWSGHTLTPAERAGFKLNDRIVSIDGHSVTSESAMIALVRSSVGRSLTIEVLRNGRELNLHATPVDGRHILVNGAPLATGVTPQGFLGIELGPQVVKDSPLQAVGGSFSLVGSTLTAALQAVVHVFSPSEVSSLVHQVTSKSYASNPSTQLSRPESIVGVIRIASQAAQTNRDALLLILMNLNVFVGLLNMFPMLPLDGGYVAIATYERLRRRGGEAYRANVAKLTPLALAVVTVLGLLFLVTLYLDLVDPITNPFR